MTEESKMTITPLAEDPIEKLKTPVLAWITDTTITEPRIEEIHATSDGFVLVRHSDETTAQMLCSRLDFLAQVGQLCVELGLTAKQAQKVVSLVQRRLG